MEHLSAREGEQLSRPNHHYGVNNLQKYCILTLNALSAIAERMDAKLEVERLDDSLYIELAIDNMVTHKIDMFLPGLVAMRPVLTKEETQSIILDIMDRVATAAPNNRVFREIKRLALG
jgi:hypothetical protein